MAKTILTGKALAEADLKVLWLDSRIVHRWGLNQAVGVSPVWRFYWNRNPDAAAIAFAGREYRLGPRAALLIAPNTATRAVLHRPMDHTFMHFSLGRPYDQIGPGVWELPVSPARRAMIESLVAAFRASRRPQWRESLLAHGVLCEALAEIPQDRWPQPSADPRVDRAIAYMERNLARTISNADLAGHVSVSPNTLARLFARHTRLAPRQYLARMRADRAAVLLQHTDKPIKAVAAECGFCNRHYLSSVFARLYGVGPAEYRKAGRRA
jgi:AraC-like DNA-binding protein